MRVITFTDTRYADFAANLLRSVSAVSTSSVYGSAVCYTVGQRFAWAGLGCELIPIHIPDGAPRANYFKPRILLDALDRFPEESHFCYLDADMLVGRRFDVDRLLRGKTFEFPLAPRHLYEVPICEIGGVRESPAALCEYFNVSVEIDVDTGRLHGNSCPYTQNCVILFGQEHREFLHEWMSWCENPYLWKRPARYFQYQDETAFNVLLWKHHATETLGYVHTTLTEFSAFERGEESDTICDMELQPGLPWSWCHDSNNLMVYHGTKEKGEAERMLRILESSAS